MAPGEWRRQMMQTAVATSIVLPPIAPPMEHVLAIGCTHKRLHEPEWQQVTAFVQQTYPAIDMVAHAGDVVDFPQFLSWCTGLPGTAKPCWSPGNHDGLHPTNVDEGHVTLPVFPQEYFTHIGYSKWETRDSLWLFTNNLSPAVNENRDVYRNVNPPGNLLGNADYSGWDDWYSTQRTWVRSELSGSHKQKFVVGHRPYEVDRPETGVSRPKLGLGHSVIDEFSHHRVLVSLGADVHRTFVCRDGAGLYHFTVDGGFARRDPVPSSLWGGTEVLLSTDKVYHRAHAFAFRFQGLSAPVMAQCIAADRDGSGAWVEPIGGMDWYPLTLAGVI